MSGRGSAEKCEEADVLDLCTGSGCIGISLGKLGNCKSVTLSDISEGALFTANENAGRNQVDVTCIQSDLFADIEGTFDVIVSNPPYIESDEILMLMPEVRDYEPRLALDGSADGLLFYRCIIKEAPKYLRKNGYLFFEIGCEQADAVSGLMEVAGFKEITIKKITVAETGLCLVYRRKWFVRRKHMFDKLEDILFRYDEVLKELSEPEVLMMHRDIRN